MKINDILLGPYVLNAIICLAGLVVKNDVAYLSGFAGWVFATHYFMRTLK